MFIELRQYQIIRGMRSKWVKLMEQEIIPFQVSQGMVVLGSFTSPEDSDLYVWMRRFRNEKERERLYKKVYYSDFWKNEIGPKIKGMLNRKKIKVTRLEPTPKSVIA